MQAQPDFEDFYARRNIRPIALGPGTPWPNRAEAAVRTFKKQVTLMVNSLADDPALADVTYRQLVRQACLARNSFVTYGGVTPLEMAFGRRPADILNLETATPSQLTSDVPTPEKKIEAVRMLRYQTQVSGLLLGPSASGLCCHHMYKKCPLLQRQRGRQKIYSSAYSGSSFRHWYSLECL